MDWCFWEIGGTRNVNIGGGGAAGSVYAGVAFGGKETPTPTAVLVQKNTMEFHGLLLMLCHMD